MKPVWLIKMYLNETYSRVWVGKRLSHMFNIKNVLKQGDPVSPLLSHFDLVYAVRRVQAKQDGWEFNGTRRGLFYADDVNLMLRGSIRTIEKNAETLEVASKETGLEVVMSREQNARRSHYKKIDNTYLTIVEEFK